MNTETRTALMESIAKWELNARAETPEDVLTGVHECPLCRMFWKGGRECRGCPIEKKTGQINCHGTPYVHADARLDEWYDGPESSVAKADFHKAAREEVEFLRSLLPFDALMGGKTPADRIATLEDCTCIDGVHPCCPEHGGVQ